MHNVQSVVFALIIKTDVNQQTHWNDGAKTIVAVVSLDNWHSRTLTITNQHN